MHTPRAMAVLLRLRDALDAADTVRFSEAEFGPVAACVPSMGPAHNETACAERVEAIVGAFATRGARVEDMAAATGGRHASRDRLGLNDAGLRVWGTNYGQYLTQLDASSTSVGRWRVGPTTDVFGHFARMTDSAAGKTNLTFALERAVFNGSDSFRSWNSSALHLRVGFFDEGRGSWQLEVGYTPPTATAAAPSSPSYELVGSVRKENTREWATAHATLLARPDISHLRITDLDQPPLQGAGGGGGDDDTFSWVEVSKIPFAYNFTSRVVNLTRA